MLSACAPVEAVYFPFDTPDIKLGEPRPADTVEIFITQKPKYKYREAGVLAYEAPSSFSNDPEAYSILREKAAQIGADAIIIVDSQSSIKQFPEVNLDFYGNPVMTDSPRSYIKYRAIAVKKL